MANSLISVNSIYNQGKVFYEKAIMLTFIKKGGTIHENAWDYLLTEILSWSFVYSVSLAPRYKIIGTL